MIRILLPLSGSHTCLQKRSDMFRFLPVILTVLSLATTPGLLFAQSELDGKKLHDEYCVSCHTPEIYTRKDRIVKNYRQLEERVRQCELSNELMWFDEEINAVITYLNNSFYHFDI